MNRICSALAIAFAGLTVFAGPLDKSWLKGETDKNPLFYKLGETMDRLMLR